MVECDEGEEEEEDDEEEDEGIEEKLGRARVVEALKVHIPYKHKYILQLVVSGAHLEQPGAIGEWSWEKTAAS